MPPLSVMKRAPATHYTDMFMLGCALPKLHVGGRCRQGRP